jgi:hypothetical protein
MSYLTGYTKDLLRRNPEISRIVQHFCLLFNITHFSMVLRYYDESFVRLVLNPWKDAEDRAVLISDERSLLFLRIHAHLDDLNSYYVHVLSPNGDFLPVFHGSASTSLQVAIDSTVKPERLRMRIPQLQPRGAVTWLGYQIDE